MPSSIVPVVSIVTETRIGTSSVLRFRSASAASTALIVQFDLEKVLAGLDDERVNPVAVVRALHRFAGEQPCACSRYESNIAPQSVFLGVMRRVPGPIEPSTKRGLSAVW